MSKENETADDEPEKKGPSIFGQTLVFLLVTAIASGAGFGASLFFKPSAPAEKQARMPEKPATGKGQKSDEKKDKEGEDGEVALSGYAIPLPPILTNLAAPSDVWVRLEAAVVAHDELEQESLEEVHQDLLAFMRTVKLHHVEGPSGFLNLSAELTDRAELRTNGAVKRILIRTILFE